MSKTLTKEELPNPCFCGLPAGTCCFRTTKTIEEQLVLDVEALKLQIKVIEDKFPKP